MSFLRSFKRSPRKEVRMALHENRPWVAERSHKQSLNFDSCDGRQLMTKDDLDLTLFTEIKTREKDDFLLHSIDDLDDSISKLRSVSKDKAGFDNLNHGESNNLLNADGGKNDYDWLLTPPDTPLFHSLDDVIPPPTNYDTRARDEKNQRPSINSANSHRYSPGNNTSSFQSRGRISSVPRSSSTSILRTSPSTPPSRKSFTNPNKLSTPSSMTATPKLRGNSPIKGSRGSSSSPKLQRHQPNTTNFALDAPPNLRTSLLDSSSSYSRGSSPASRNAKKPYSKHGRQSISPIISRSASSSRSHDHKRNSTHNKVSDASYDGGESLQSASVRISKKASRTPSPSSAPKKSFDFALRQMNHQKTPQNMFRPLISSVPSSSSFTVKENTMHHPFLSRNSSVTTTYDVGSGVALNTEDYGHQANHSSLHEEVFDKMGEIEEDAKYEMFLGRTSIDDDELDKSMVKKIKSGYEIFPFEPDETDPAISETLCIGDHSFMDSIGRMLNCSICGESFQTGNVDNMNICQDCSLKNILSDQMGIKIMQHSTQMEENHHKIDHAVNVACDLPYSKENTFELFDQMDSNAVNMHPAKNVEVPDNVIVSQLRKADQPDQVHQTLQTLQSTSSCKFKNSTPFSPSSSLRSDGYEGIVVQDQGMTFTDSNTTYSEISCTGENQNATSNYSPSLDLALLKRREEHIQSQPISLKDSTDSLKHDLSSKSYSSLSLSPKSPIQPSETKIEGDQDQLHDDFEGKSSSVIDECCSKTVEDIDGGASSIGLCDQEHTELVCSKNSHISAPTIDPQTCNQASILQQVSEINQIDEKNATEIRVSSDDIASDTCIENERGKVFDTNVICKFSVSSLEMENNDSFKSSDLDDDCFSISCNDILSEKGNYIDHHVLNDDSHAENIHGDQSSHGQQTRSLTLEDTAYTLHFCNSIVQDLVYKAATIGVEKKQAYTTEVEVPRPTVTILEKPISDQKTTIKTPLPKSQKPESKTSDVLLPTNVLNNTKDRTKVEEESDDTDLSRQISHSGTVKTAKAVSKCMCTVM